MRLPVVMLLLAAVSCATEVRQEFVVVARYEKSLRANVDGFPMLVLRGTHAERGKAHGYLGAREIVKTVDAMATTLRLSDASEGEESKWAKAKSFLHRFEIPERFGDELEGMLAGIEEALPSVEERTLSAAGRPVSLGDLHMLTCGDVLELARCSQFSAWGDLTKDGSIVIGRNWDYPPIFPFDTYCILAVDPEEKSLRKTLDAMWFGMIGSGLASLNEEGVYLSANDGGNEEKNVINAPYPGMLAMRMAAEHASFEEPLKAVEQFLNQRVALNLLFHLVAPRSGSGRLPRAWIFEHVPGSKTLFEKHLRQPREEMSQALFVTNTPMIGRKDTGSDCERYESLLAALSAAGKANPIDLGKAVQMLDDVSVSMTQYSAVVLPEQREMHVAASRTPGASATKEPYTRVRWEDVWALTE